MRPSDLLYLVSPPIGSTAFFLQEEWLAALVAGVVLALLSAFIHDVHREGGFWEWFRGGIETAKELEEFRNGRVGGVEQRRMDKLEAEQARREFRDRHSSRADQMKLFPR